MPRQKVHTMSASMAMTAAKRNRGCADFIGMIVRSKPGGEVGFSGQVQASRRGHPSVPDGFQVLAQPFDYTLAILAVELLLQFLQCEMHDGVGGGFFGG